MLNKKNIRLGNVDLFINSLAFDGPPASPFYETQFDKQFVVSLILEFLHHEDSFDVLKNNLVLIFHICVKLKEFKFITRDLLKIIEKKFRGKQRSLFLKAYLVSLSTHFAQVSPP